MKKQNLSLFNWTAALVMLVTVIFWLTGCSKEDSVLGPQENQADNAVLEKIALSDEAVASFEPNYNEEDVTGFVLGKVSAEIYPVKVWQKMTRVAKNFTVTYSGDSAFGKVVSNFDGTLFLAGSYTKPASGTSVVIDTVVSKKFSTVITHNIIFVKSPSMDTSKMHWKVAAVSLPQGGTLTGNISLQKITVFFPNDTLIINSPNDYYLYRQMGHKRMIPSLRRSDEAHIRVELVSASSDTDFVTGTHGAVYNSIIKKHFNRVKTNFTLVSSTPQGTQYYKVYEASIKANQNMGYFHAVVNAFPRAVVMDDGAPVETSTWGVPYIVK